MVTNVKGAVGIIPAVFFIRAIYPNKSALKKRHMYTKHMIE